MRVKNYTKYDTKKLKEMIRFCKPSKITNFDIVFKNTDTGVCGRAYCAGCSLHSTSAPFVTIRIGDEERFIKKAIKKGVCRADGSPINWKHLRYPRIIDYNGEKKRGYIRYIALDKDEHIVHVIAHELRHLWQSKVTEGHRVWGARGKFSERDADAYAIRKTREWRKKIKLEEG
jgi:hypothetical protein